MKIALTALLLLTVWTCNPTKPEKPATVPKDAIWKGGFDGGCWILFGSITEVSIEATIFYENGEPWDKGIFKKHGNCQITKETLVENIVAFDGESLVTNERCSFDKDAESP